MPELGFAIDGVEAVRYAAVPQLRFKLQVSGGPVESVWLQCQIQVESPRRRYSEAEQARLAELFGEPSRWSRTLRTFLWTQINLMVPAFGQDARVDLPVACSFDFNVAATKYFAALETGELPLAFQFSGSVFYRADDGALQVGRIAWDREAKYALPVAVWRELIERYYPDSAWLCLPRGLFERLDRYRLARGLLTWEQGLESLLAVAGKEAA